MARPALLPAARCRRRPATSHLASLPFAGKTAIRSWLLKLGFCPHCWGCQTAWSTASPTCCRRATGGVQRPLVPFYALAAAKQPASTARIAAL